MLSFTIQEDAILDKLDQQTDIRNLLTVAIEFISTSVYELIMTVFRKENHALNYVIPSLIGSGGPLNNISVRLRLLYALGILSRDEYEDIELLMAILEGLNKTDKKYNITDDEIMASISLLHNIVLPKEQKNTNHQVSIYDDEINLSMHRNRYQQAIRSALILAITEITLCIVNKQNISYFP